MKSYLSVGGKNLKAARFEFEYYVSTHILQLFGECYLLIFSRQKLIITDITIHLILPWLQFTSFGIFVNFIHLSTFKYNHIALSINNKSRRKKNMIYIDCNKNI